MSEPVDLLIVGAGPGGSNAAAAALDGGLTVAQVDGLPFPRVKPCAGGLTVKALDSLQRLPAGVLRRDFTDFEFNLHPRPGRGGSGFRHVFSHRTRILAMVSRPELDNRLVEENKKRRGFSFFDGERVRGIEWDGELFRAETTARSLAGRQLVGADGAYSRVNRLFRIAEPRLRATAVEVNLYRADVSGDPAPRPCFDYGAIERGYGWVFPKDDHWSLGLYTLESGIKDLRRRLGKYVSEKGFEVMGDPLATFEAHLIPLGGYRLRAPEAPVYLVGDAGGFADALTGEGIFHALESGRLAGRTAVDVARGRGSHRAYYRRLWRRVLPDTWMSYQLSKPFYGHLSRSLSLLGRGVIWRPLVHGYGRGTTLAGCLVRGAGYLLASWVRGASSRRTIRPAS